MDMAWERYLERLADILGEDSDFDISTLSKPSGPFGAVLHMQWLVKPSNRQTVNLDSTMADTRLQALPNMDDSRLGLQFLSRYGTSHYGHILSLFFFSHVLTYSLGSWKPKPPTTGKEDWAYSRRMHFRHDPNPRSLQGSEMGYHFWHFEMECHTEA